MARRGEIVLEELYSKPKLRRNLEMKTLKITVLLFVAVLIFPLCFMSSVESQSATEALTTDMNAQTDDLFNGFGARGTPVDECVAEPEPPTVRGNGTFEENLFIFSERETIDDGLGPTYNDTGCVECHQFPDPGAFAQQMEFRAGRTVNGIFTDPPGGQLIHARATDARIMERINTGQNTRAFRVVLSTLGDGFVECLANSTLEDNVAAQPLAQRGTLTNVPVTEANNTLRRGRFGWKAQQASLVSFSGDAYLNEMGITNPFDGFGGRSSSNPEAGTDENPATTVNADGTFNVINVNFPSPFDPVPDPEDDGLDVLAFADFMAATRAPGRGPINDTVRAGQTLFNSIGCAVCHTPTLTTAPAGTLINGGAFRVPAALGNKIIHPYSDFALHNIGTGDGIVQNAGQGSANQIRTAPLWGLRARNRLMHDGLTVTLNDAIQRHAGQATTSRNNFNALTAGQRTQVFAFILSL
jgi:CxxC motif-containing protein (DUF1111 family)